MSMTNIINAAVSGLAVAQAGMRNTSNNIANVNTPNYARKTVIQEPQVLNGTGVGVSVGEVRRVTDQFLVRQLQASTSEVGRLDTLTAFQAQIQNMFGKPEDNSSITGKLADVINGLTQLTTDATSSARRQGAISDLKILGDELNREAQELQDLRLEADQRIGDQLLVANTAIRKIHDLNVEISRARIDGGESGALEDKRATALAELAKVLDFNTYDAANSAITVTLSNGQPLVDNFAYRLDYSPAGQVGPGSGFNSINLSRVNLQTGLAVGGSVAVDEALRSGTLRGLLDMRDTIIPNLASQLGEFAGQVVDQLNAVHNENSPVPPPESMSGRNTGLLGTDQHGFTGQATFVALDSGEAVAAAVTIDFDGGGFTTIDDVVTAINAGLAGSATASFANGVFSLSAGTAAGVVVQQGTPPADRGGQGFSKFFGLNDLLTGSVPASYATGLEATDASGFSAAPATALTLAMRGPDAGERSVTIDFSTLSGPTIGDIVNDLNTGFAGVATFALDADGALNMTPAAGFSDWRLTTVSDTTDRGGTGIGFSTLFGLGETFTAGRAFGVAVRADIVSDPSLLALAKVDSTATGVALSTGDARGASELAAVGQGRFVFGAAGGIGAQTSTLSDYAEQIVGRAATTAAAARSAADDRAALHTEIGQRLSSIEGVNIDEELSNMISLQSAYNASARMISTAKEMFDTLLKL